MYHGWFMVWIFQAESGVMMSGGYMTKHMFDIYLESHFGNHLVREYRFHPIRKWRFDWCFPSGKIALEYEGIFSRKSRHTTKAGYSGDCEKYNHAALLGWRVFRFTAPMLEQGKTIDFLNQALAEFHKDFKGLPPATPVDERRDPDDSREAWDL
jgi:hypothetical protein